MEQEKRLTFQDLVVWQKSHQLAMDVYRATKKFPKEERDALGATLRHAAAEVPANIAAGFRSRVQPEKFHLYNQSLAALERTRYYLILTRDLGFLKDYEALWNLAEEVGRMLGRLARSARSQQNRGQ
ncbi:MAG: four helix bundle protein [candidate division KSB1 bacterium]|nr:four helix bundle protein [candidate division KSB1 bacterium]MDZ7294014.1 four helix bundle protein [candidate division KSB1 bacterium]MDZ7378735.1 four helix bundle protein [candidate division KSB1 bacterium]MDZ7385825.1 four helix bundle protein [candidate division KSB1 bacterium]MDZ7392718.1 four helix bundle protein [candidate division KSB1 bacterium]